MATSMKRRQFGRPVGQQRGRAFMAAVGISGLLLAGLTFYIGYEAAYSVPGRGYYNLHAKFKDANNLSNHYEVRLGGVRAGQVLNPRVSHGEALVDLKLDNKFKPLPADSKLEVRLRSAVGVRYLELIPGTSQTTLKEGATIPATQVLPSVALDQVLGTFDRKTRAATSTLLRELGTGVAGRGTDLNDVVRDTPRLLTGLRGTANAITARPGAVMSSFIHNGSQAAKGFDDARQDIVAGFRPETQALRVFTDNRSGVQGTLTEAAPTLATVRSQLPAVDRLVAETAGLAQRARPVFRAAPSSLRKTTDLLQNAKQPLKDLNDTLQLAKDAVNPTLSLLGSIKPSLPTIDSTLTSLQPQIDYIGPRACEVNNVVASWGQYLGIGDSQNNFIRFQLLAVRPEQTAGQAGKGPAALNNLYDHFVNRDPYYGPCTNHGSEGATGLQHPVPAKIVNAGIKPLNRTDNLPYETDPNIVASASQIIKGGK